MGNLISIIIPIYNVEKYLDKCVNSVVRQTYADLEIILIDDGSPDHCPQICDAWAKKDDRIKVIHKQNGGLSDARNVGLNNSTGDFVMFLDSDDYISDNMCETLMALIKKYNVSMAMCDFVSFYEDEPIVVKGEDIVVNYYDEKKLRNLIYESNIESLVMSCAKLFKKEVFNKLRYPLGRLHEDEFLIHEILYNAGTMVHTNEKMYYYLNRKTGITGTKKQKNIMDTLQAFKNRNKFLMEKFPEDKNKNNLLYLGNLRRLYIYKPWATKELKREILGEYKEVYRNTRNKPIKEKIFRMFPNVSSKIARKQFKLD